MAFIVEMWCAGCMLIANATYNTISRSRSQ